MTEQCKHDWMAWRHIDADRFLTDTIMFFKCRNCHKRMGVSEVEARLNEYETLKAATERLSAEIVIRNIIIYGEGGFVTDRFLSALKTYADTLEGK